MSEAYIPPQGIAINQQQGSAEFGPTAEDIAGYQMLLDELDKPENAGRKSSEIVGYDVRNFAELCSDQIDRGSVGTFINRNAGEVGLDARAEMRFSQVRYIAGALGLNVGERIVHLDSYTAGSDISMPCDEDLPPLPTLKNQAGQFLDQEGKPYSKVRLDALYSAHFIVQNLDFFSQSFDATKGELGEFETMFLRVVREAEAGSLEVADKVGFQIGAASMVRQMARVMGYVVGDYAKGTDGILTAPVTGRRQGFADYGTTHFMRAVGVPR